jgi:ribosomal protein S18 acetylase RimI-like enzyme
MIFRDWRGVEAAVVGECYERERLHWQDALGWDTAWTWATVEQARLAGTLPGVLALNRFDRVEGWAFHMTENGTLHIGGLVADDADTTAALVDVLLRDGTAAAVSAEACFILDRAQDLEPTLAARGFDVERFHYLSLALGSAPEIGLERPSPPGIDRWRTGDAAAAALLLEASYTPAGRVHFAPTGDWTRYVSGLVHQSGCGTFAAGLSRVIRGDGDLDAVVMASVLSPATAHIAQVAVRPAKRGRGVASALVREVAHTAAQDGKQHLTLLVGDRNQTARRLYAAMGFQPRATFVAARREMARTRRVSSIA